MSSFASPFRRRLMLAYRAPLPNYLCFTALEEGTFTISFNSVVSTSWIQYVEYSTDEGKSWVKVQNVDNETVTHTTPTVLEGKSILWRGSGVKTGRVQYRTTFTSTCRFNASGNPSSLLRLNAFENMTTFGEDAFCGLFFDCKTLISAYNLELPATKIYANSFRQMFSGCTNLTHAPKIISATTLEGTQNYYEMFNGCSSLVSPPELPATTLKASCYNYMFSGCTSLVKAPELPATVLADTCYQGMFNGCTSLTSAPELPATTLAKNCYSQMFKGCTSLSNAPELPATTLMNGCYMNMFQNCISLLTAPMLPALTLKAECYQAMFYAAKNVSYVKMLATDISASNCLNIYLGSVNNVSTSIFVKHIDATWTTTGTSGVPTNWTIIYYDPTDDKYYTDQTKATECDDHGNPIV